MECFIKEIKKMLSMFFFLIFIKCDLALLLIPAMTSGLFPRRKLSSVDYEIFKYNRF